MWYDQAKWVGICKYWFRDRAKPKEMSAFVFYSFDNISIGPNFAMVCPILMGFYAKHSSLNGENTQVEN